MPRRDFPTDNQIETVARILSELSARGPAGSLRALPGHEIRKRTGVDAPTISRISSMLRQLGAMQVVPGETAAVVPLQLVPAVYVLAVRLRLSKANKVDLELAAHSTDSAQSPVRSAGLSGWRTDSAQRLLGATSDAITATLRRLPQGATVAAVGVTLELEESAPRATRALYRDLVLTDGTETALEKALRSAVDSPAHYGQTPVVPLPADELDAVRAGASGIVPVTLAQLYRSPKGRFTSSPAAPSVVASSEAARTTATATAAKPAGAAGEQPAARKAPAPKAPGDKVRGEKAPTPSVRQAAAPAAASPAAPAPAAAASAPAAPAPAEGAPAPRTPAVPAAAAAPQPAVLLTVTTDAVIDNGRGSRVSLSAAAPGYWRARNQAAATAARGRAGNS